MKIDILYRYFLLSPASHLPVVGASGNFLGLLPRKRVMMEMSDLSLSDREFDEIPLSFLELGFPESITDFFKAAKSIQVLNTKGEVVANWDKPRLLAELSRLEEKPAETETSEKSDPAAAKQTEPINWFMEMVLHSFPDGLLATDLEGKTLFFNEAFETIVLKKRFFRDSLVHTEKYLKNLNKDLMARYLREHDLSIQELSGLSLQTFLKEADLLLRVMVLHSEQKIIGYLYHFLSLTSATSELDEEGRDFPSVSEMFRKSIPLEEMLQEVESHYIYYALKKNHENISHAASALGLPRTTLQNRIRFLHLDSRFSMEKEGPVPRKKKKAEKSKTESKASVSNKKAKKSATKKTVKPLVKKSVPKKKASPKKVPSKKVRKRK